MTSLLEQIWREHRDSYALSGVRMWVDAWRSYKLWRTFSARHEPGTLHAKAIHQRRAVIRASRITVPKPVASGETYLTRLSSFNKSDARVSVIRLEPEFPNTSMENWSVENRRRWWSRGLQNVAQSSLHQTLAMQQAQRSLLNSYSQQALGSGLLGVGSLLGR